jgi:hypothetical protein
MKRNYYLLFILLTLSNATNIYSQRLSNEYKLPIKSTILNQLPLPNKNELLSYKNIFKPNIHITSFTTESSSSYNKSLFSTDYLTSLNTYQYNVRNQIGLEVSGIPIKFEYIKKESMPIFYDDSKNWYNVSFDIEKYKEKWKSLAEKIGPEALSKYGEQAKALKQTILEKLKTDAKEKVKSNLTKTLDSITGGINPLELEGKTPQEIGTMFFGLDINQLLEDSKKKIEELKSQNLTAIVKDSLMRDLERSKDEFEKKSNYIAKVEKLIKKAKSSGLLDLMKGLEGKSKDEYDKLLQNPEQLAKTMAAKYNLGSFQKILSLLSQFKAGGQSLPFSGTPNIPFLGKGISFELKLGDRFLGFSTGKLFPVFNNFSFADLSGNNTTAQPQQDKSSYWFLNYRKGFEDNNHKGIKLTSISTQTSGANGLGVTGLKPKNILLVNLYSKERIFQENWLSAELSKTIIQKINTYNINGTTVDRDNKVNDLLSLDNLAIKVAVDGKFETAGITHQIFFKKTLGASANITESNLLGNGYETGFSLKMRKKENKLSYSVKGVIKNYDIPGNLQSSWKSADIRTRVGYKLKKGQNVQLSTFLHNGYKSYINGEVFRYIKQNTKGFTADFNLVNKRIFGLYNTSFISTGFQRDAFPSLSTSSNEMIKSNAYNILLNQTFLYGDHLLTMNCFYTKVSQDVNTFFYNTKLDIDAGGNFKINKKLNIGMSLVYGYFKDAYTNIGLKSSLSTTILKKMQVDINADVRKNIQLINPLFDQFVNLSCDLKYTIK